MSRLLKSKEAANYLCISERTLWNLQNIGKIKTVRMGRLIRFDPIDLDEFIEQAKTVIS
ncbi:MAG: helix-turn-helix domain-containing protein [Planctomycetes bacterium]|nr:helix-turn-helix domain-containing protein [Planctomycetota bacterium]